jgi:hypothetical protein
MSINPDHGIVMEILPLDRPSPTGKIYPRCLLEAALAEGGQLRGLIDRDTVYGEVNAPTPQPHQAEADAHARFADVALDRICLKVEDLYIDDARSALMGRILPFGPMGDMIHELMQKKIPFSVGMRGFIKSERLDGGQYEQVTELRAVVAFDLTPPGRGVAGNPALEEVLREQAGLTRREEFGASATQSLAEKYLPDSTKH